MAVESTIQASAGLIPRHYIIQVQAALAPAAMVELMQALRELDVADDACGGFFGKLREACEQAWTGDLPQPITVPDVPPEEEGGVTAEPGH